MYSQHNYYFNHIWNSNETRIQVGKQFGTRDLARRGSNVVYYIISKSWEFLIANYAINVVGGVLLCFYILRGERLWDDYIKLCKPGTCMAMQKKNMDDYFHV